MESYLKNKQFYKFSFYGFLKNLRFFDAFFILFLIEKGLSFTQIGILYAFREIFINIAEIPSGIVADTFGRKNALLGSFIAYIISFVVFYSANDFLLFLAAFMFYGIGDAFRTGTHKGMIMDYLKFKHWDDQKIIYYGHTRSWSQIGSAISSLFAGIIVFNSGSYQHIFIYSIVPYLLNFLLILSYPKALNSSINKASNKNLGIVQTLKSFFKIIQKPSVLKIMNTSASHTAYLRAVKDYIQPLMINVAILIPLFADIDTTKKNGLIIGVIYFLIYLITSRASQLSSKIAAKSKNNAASYTMLFGFISGIICGVFFIYELWIVSLIAFIGIYIAENIRKPILTGLIADNVPPEILTSVISAQSLLRTIITAILAIIFGISVDTYGIGISFVMISILILLFMLIISITKKNQNT